MERLEQILEAYVGITCVSVGLYVTFRFMLGIPIKYVVGWLCH